MTFDSKDHPIEGPNVRHGATSSAQRVNNRNLVMTERMDGKVTDTQEMALSADGKTLTITVRFEGRGKPNVLVFQRQ